MENVKESRAEIHSSVKWNLFDFVLLYAVYNLLEIICVNSALSASGFTTGFTPVLPDKELKTIVQEAIVQELKDEEVKPEVQQEVRTDRKSTAEHPLTQLIQQSGTNYSVLLLAFISGVIAAPLAEEFLFRLVLQSYLEKFLCRITADYAGITAVVFTSLLFASLHGSQRQTMPPDFLQAMMTGLTIGSILFFIFGIIYLTVFRKANAQDLGWDSNYFRRYLLADIKTALVWAVFTIPAVMLIHIEVKLLLPDGITDPVPLFFFSLVLGCLFYKTRRLAPSVFLHLLFNGFNFTVLLLLPFFG